MMIEETTDHIFYKLPDQFRYCMVSECPKSSTCLWYEVFTNVPSTLEHFPILNPEYLRAKDLDHCNYFYPQDLKLFVAGLHGAIDNLPKQKFEQVRLALIDLMGKNNYYRFMRCERWLVPRNNKKLKHFSKNSGLAMYWYTTKKEKDSSKHSFFSSSSTKNISMEFQYHPDDSSVSWA